MRAELTSASGMGADSPWQSAPDDQVMSEYAKVTGGPVTPAGGAAPGAGGQFSFLQALQNQPTLEARRFMLEARARPDILGSIRAESGLPYGVQGPTAGLPGATADISNNPRFQELQGTPFVQALQGFYSGQQGAGSDTALNLPATNEIPFTWYNQQSPDVQAATKGLYPGLTTQGFLQPFVQAISSLGRNTGTRYA